MKMISIGNGVSRILNLVSLVLVSITNPSTLQSQTFPGQIGVEVDDRPLAFVNLQSEGQALIGGPLDANGWPMSDCIAVVFDQRPIPAWAPPIDDPAQYQPDVSGTYLVSFQGQATLTAEGGSPITFSDQAYDPATNITTVNVTLPAGVPALMSIQFTNTQRTAGSGTNTGITNLRIIRPDYPADTTQIFDTSFLTAIAPFSWLRFMNWLNTNFDPGYYGDPGHHLINWADRSLPSDARQGMGTSFRAGAQGKAWEYVILLANAVNRDVWINIPISATGSDPSDTSSYIYNLALLLKNGNAFTGNQGLKPGLHIYIEHSNEVWNYGFPQYAWNKLAAIDEVNQGGSPLNNDGSTDEERWARRRHAKRLYEIAKVFEAVYGSGSLNNVIRPVYAHWSIYPGEYADTLNWMNNTYGAPSNYFHAVAQGAYFNEIPMDGETVPEILAEMQASSDAEVTFTQQIQAVAVQFGLKHYAYEGGPDNGGGSPTNIGNRILANRDPSMGTLLEHHIRDNWFGNGPDGFTQFTLSYAYSRYGSWGATDDYRNVSTPKYQALLNLLGSGPPVGPPGYTYCAPENDTCNFTGSASVAYGANGQFNYGSFTSGTPCNNSVFGDPIFGVVKACFYKLNP